MDVLCSAALIVDVLGGGDTLKVGIESCHVTHTVVLNERHSVLLSLLVSFVFWTCIMC